MTGCTRCSDVVGGTTFIFFLTTAEHNSRRSFFTAPSNQHNLRDHIPSCATPKESLSSSNMYSTDPAHSGNHHRRRLACLFFSLSLSFVLSLRVRPRPSGVNY